MSQNTTSSGDWDIQQSNLYDILDVAFTVILIIAGMLTFPPACFVYWRILTLKSFKTQYLLKLFVVNGASDMLIYLVNLVAIQFCNWPSFFGFYTWLKDTFLSLALRYLQDFSLSVMWQTTYFISLNRLFSLKNQYLLSKYDFHFFLFASISSVLVSVIISFPLFFSHFMYTIFPVTKGLFGYIPYVPKEYRWTSIPATVHQLTCAAGTLFNDVIICFHIMNLRKELSSKMKKRRPEQGLLLSSIISLIMHVINNVIVVSGIHSNFNSCKFFHMVVKNTGDDLTAYFITPTVAVATTLPFWTMMICAHSMRRAILAGTIFGAAKMTVRVKSAQNRTTASAHF